MFLPPSKSRLAGITVLLCSLCLSAVFGLLHPAVVFAQSSAGEDIIIAVSAAASVTSFAADRSGSRMIDAEPDNTDYTKVITPQDYGAVGDGKHDDTSAIQQCIAENPHANIVFPKGIYNISKTIYLYGYRGGQHIDFGGARLRWKGAASKDAVMFEITDPDEDHLDTTGCKESRAYLEGGSFYGADKCGTAIMSNSYHATISDFKCYDFTRAMIVIGDVAKDRSMQNVVKNGVMMMSEITEQGWSEKNEVVGIEINEPDNFFREINVNRTRTGIRIIGSGNEFVNCHFTAQYQEIQDHYGDCYAVVLDPLDSGNIFSDEFLTCYFDNYKYCFWVEKPTAKVITVSNSKYFFINRQLTREDMPVFDSYILGNYSAQINVDQFTVIPCNGTLRFHDSSLVKNFNLEYYAASKESYIHTTYGINKEIIQPGLAPYLVASGERVPVASTATPWVPLKYYEIGCLMMPAEFPLTAMEGTTIRCVSPGEGIQEITLQYEPDSDSLIAKTASDKSGSGWSLLAGTPEIQETEGIKMRVVPLYLNTGVSDASMIKNVEIQYNMPVRGYLYTLRPIERENVSVLEEKPQP